jgi:hypothetical protein
VIVFEQLIARPSEGGLARAKKLTPRDQVSASAQRFEELAEIEAD